MNRHGLGYSYSTEYESVGNTFVETVRKIDVGLINGIANFSCYDNYKKFVDFIESSEDLKFTYKLPFENREVEYFKDIKMQRLEKSEIQTNGFISENVVFDCLTLWYEEVTAIYTIEPQKNEIRWDFVWDSKFVDYDTRNLVYINKGHVESPILLEMSGHLVNPFIELYIEGELYQTVKFKIDIAEYEKLLYGTKENEFYINKQKTDGTLESLFSLDVIDFENDNVIRIPKNKSCEIRLKAENEVLNAKLTILAYYRAV